jgi:hypothetical protein
MSPRRDWPLGPELERRRIAAGLSVRAAARRTHGKVSDGRWYQLESGFQRVQGNDIPISTTPPTVAAAAAAVGWDITDALRTAGFDPADTSLREEDRYLQTGDVDNIADIAPSLQDMPLRELLKMQSDVQAEVMRRYYAAKCLRVNTPPI